MTKYEKIADELKKLLLFNLKQGINKLPTEAEICQKYQVSRQTVRCALSILEQEALITRIQGSGAYATGRSPENGANQIALILASDSEYTYPTLLQKLHTALKKEGYDVSVYITQNQFSTERNILTTLSTAKLRGIIAEPVKTGIPNPNVSLYETFAAENIPLIFLQGCSYNFQTGCYIKEDNFSGGYQLTRHLLRHGHTQFAGIFKADSLQGSERYLGCHQAIQEQNLSFMDEHILWFTDEQLNALQKKQDTGFLLDFIQQKLTSCSAVICHNDEIAYWLIKLLTRCGIRVPDEISVTGFDNSYLSTLSAPQITTAGADTAAIASAVVTLLTSRLQGKNVTSQSLSLRLYERESTGYPC